jgi:hypothetical protein
LATRKAKKHFFLPFWEKKKKKEEALTCGNCEELTF